MRKTIVDIARFELDNEIDVKLSFKRAVKLGEFAGLNISDRTQFANAVAKVGRNAVEYAGKGMVDFLIQETDDKKFLVAKISDHGMGIQDLESILKRKQPFRTGRGMGLVNARNSVEIFDIETGTTGTCIQLGKRLNPKTFNKHTLTSEWNKHLREELQSSPYEEVKHKNIALSQLTDKLNAKNKEAQSQIEEIKRLNERLDSFAYTVSHDLKAPLKNIEGIIHLMEDVIPKNEESEHLLGLLKTSVDKMNSLINDVFIYSKFGVENLQKTRVDVQKEIKELAAIMEGAEKFHISIITELPILWTEQVYIHQIFSNLIGNAIKYHDKDNGSISISCEEDKNHFLFSVRDDGPGISAREQDKIFRMFYTTQPGRKSSSGLGLAIVKKIVELKGGKIWVESDGRGTTFVFTWPVSEALSFKN